MWCGSPLWRSNSRRFRQSDCVLVPFRTDPLVYSNLAGKRLDRGRLNKIAARDELAPMRRPGGGRSGGRRRPANDFNRVYGEYIAPALEAAGLEAFRADEEIRAGDIRTDMFQERLVADLVIADLSIDNPNVWYELGVHHALRARGVVLFSGGRVPTAFDLTRTARYGPCQDCMVPFTI